MANTIDTLGDKATTVSILDKSITEYIDDELTTVGAYAFYGCTELQSVSLPNVDLLDSYAFAGCTALTSYDIPAVSKLPEYCFSECTNLTAVDLSGIESISGYVFDSCTALATVTGTADAIDIGNAAFSGCTSLKTIALPAAESIWSMAFAGCTSLQYLILGNAEQVVTIESDDILDGADDAIVYVPDALVDSYKSDEYWSTYADRIKSINELEG